jgi:hypothetical protein
MGGGAGGKPSGVVAWRRAAERKAWSVCTATTSSMTWKSTEPGRNGELNAEFRVSSTKKAAARYAAPTDPSAANKIAGSAMKGSNISSNVVFPKMRI